MDLKGNGLTVCGICCLIAAELYFKAPGWVIGWSIFALFCSIPQQVDRRSKMTNKVKTAGGLLAAIVVVLFCACICGLVLGGLISANILLWHWIISMLQETSNETN